MKPYIEVHSEKIYLQQVVDLNRFEVCSKELNGNQEFLLCPKVKTRYRQATGAYLVRNGNELQLATSGGALVKYTFPLDGLEFYPIKADWQAGGPITIQHGSEEAAEENAE